jgi:hypothetical protein
MTAELIRGAIGQLGGQASPPQIRRLLRLPNPNVDWFASEPDQLAVRLEMMRQHGELTITWTEKRFGNGLYSVAERRQRGVSNEPGCAAL